VIRCRDCVAALVLGKCSRFGSGAGQEFAKTDRVLAEMEGVALTALFSGLGVIAKATADRVDENEGNISLTESLRKWLTFYFSDYQSIPSSNIESCACVTMSV
jgi:hypothetical protein